MGRASDDCGCAYKTDEEKANGAVSISYTNQVVKDEERTYLRTLPAHIRVDFQLNQDKLNLLLVHGSPLPQVFAVALRTARSCWTP